MDKECPTCGFRGDFEICPNDQSIMVTAQKIDLEPSIMPVLDPIGTEASENVHESGGLVGRTLADRYDILEILGIGGMGTVYLARQRSMNRLVAVKVLSPQFSQNPQMIRRFEKEANVVSKLSHPNTVSVFDYGRSDGSVFLVMERLEGVSLKTYLAENGPLLPEMSVHVVTQILRSLHQAHGVGIIHRDIKPANIFIVSVKGEKHLTKVLDFGVAKLNQSAGDDTVTQAGGIIGTPRYMAPEQARSLETDERADLYAVGILLFELLTGTTPFNGENPIGVMMDHAQKPVPPMALPFEETNQYGNLESIVTRALEKRPIDRYQSAEAMLKALDDWQKPPLAPIKNNQLSSPLVSRERSGNVNKFVLAVVALGFVGLAVNAFLSAESTNEVRGSLAVVDKPRQETKNVTKVETKVSVPILVSTQPPSQLVRIKDGFNFGQTPITIPVDEPVDLKADKKGYQPKQFTLTRSSESEVTFQLEAIRKPTKRESRSKKSSTAKARKEPTSPVQKPSIVERPRPLEQVIAPKQPKEMENAESETPTEML